MFAKANILFITAHNSTISGSRLANAKCSPKFTLRYASCKLRISATLAEIFLFFFGLSPNCFKKFSNFFFFIFKGDIRCFLRFAPKTVYKNYFLGIQYYQLTKIL